MANILQAKVTILGTRTLAIHHFGIDALPLEATEKDGVAGNSPNEWRKTVLMDEERQLFLLPTYFFGCIKYGGKTVKRGKSNLLTDIASTLQVMDDQIYICNSDGPIKLPDPPQVIEAGTIKNEKLPDSYVEVIGVRNPSTKARNIRYRVAVKPGWHCSFTILWDSVVVDRKSLETAIINAGTLVGIGDGRQSIGYGRFELTNFAIV
ncbi:MAG: hypothetical protein KME32_00505 [Mojavia pulchra JT2-VF2]|jgi:hypothetical protein|uniref:Uncharacterized protein n=1 Tax=Mojavia pulchra JT2-VF2 TaxID=287848 RepID=A0A951PSS6_9NOST|nr:hypothetical protein [Mojavia pulchra JT2-VF2]